MAIVTLLAFAFCAGLSGSANAAFRSSEGTPVSIEEFPSLVQVDFRGVGTGAWSQSCAASILNSRNVLSAANCFSGIAYDPSNRRIRAGATNRNTGGVISHVQAAYNHPYYGQYSNDADISVVRLYEALVYSAKIAPGTIIVQGAAFHGGLPMTHAGWGTTIQEGSASPVLLKNNIFTIDNQFCKEQYEGLSIPEPVTENMICVGFLGPDAERSACLGDFGGPIYYNDEGFGDIIIGVGSWGHGCSNVTFPAVSTAIASYTDWIVSVAV